MTDLAIIESGLVVTNENGEPTHVIEPGTGEMISLDDIEGLARWRRTITDLKFEALRPVERLVDEAIYVVLDRAGKYTFHTADGLEVTGESAAAWQDATQVDGAGLYDDLLTLRMRGGDTRDEAVAWINELCRVEITFTAAGRSRLQKMAGAYREALEEHTRPVERARKSPSVRRAK